MLLRDSGFIAQISIMTMGLGAGTLLAGLFGMNVRFPWVLLFVAPTPMR